MAGVIREPYVVSWKCEDNRFWRPYATRTEAEARMAELNADDTVSEVLLEVDL